MVDRAGFDAIAEDERVHTGVRAVARLTEQCDWNNFVLQVPTLLMMLAERRAGAGLGDCSVLIALKRDRSVDPLETHRCVLKPGGSTALGECWLDMEILEREYLWAEDSPDRFGRRRSQQQFVAAVRRELHAIRMGGLDD